ncbi:MAG: virion core protein (lumpy skin disease virus) [Firmicutes bacterium]|nr:virion core protein (lumpy skin disease virus) [Bacillota bacterium]
MAFMDFVKKQFLDIIEWEDDSQDVLQYKFPMQDNEIQSGGKLIVRPGQAAVFLNEGKIADVFTEPGTYTLNTQNLPILGDLKGWAFGFNSPFKADVYFINTKNFLDQKWGTPTPVLVPDPKFEQIEIKAFGTFSFRIINPGQFLVNITSTNREYTVSMIRDQLRSFIVSNFLPIIVQQKVTVAELAANYKIIDKAVEVEVDKEFGSLGLDMTSFQILSITMQEEYQEMMRKRSAVNIMGGMQNYAQVEVLDAMKQSTQNPGMNAMNQAGLGLGMGVGMGGVFAQNLQQAFQPPPPAGNVPFQQPYQQQPQQPQPPQQQAPPSPQVVPGAQPDPNMMQCASCQASITANSKFCMHCGAKVEPPQPPPKVVFCNQCGTKIEGGGKFCNECGNKIG